MEVRRRSDEHDEGEVESAELRPGQSTRFTLNLVAGLDDIECFVGDHDDLGMRGVLEVRDDAPLVAPAGTRSTVAIRSFAFKPATVRTTAGTVVIWRNFDPAPHTASAKQLSSPQLGRGAAYRRRFAQPGTYSYLCALHPGMRGKVVVARKAAR